MEQFGLGLVENSPWVDEVLWAFDSIKSWRINFKGCILKFIFCGNYMYRWTYSDAINLSHRIMDSSLDYGFYFSFPCNFFLSYFVLSFRCIFINAGLVFWNSFMAFRWNVQGREPPKSGSRLCAVSPKKMIVCLKTDGFNQRGIYEITYRVFLSID